MIYPEHAAVMAPLSGYTDAPFRMCCRAMGCVYAFTPLVDAGMLVYGRGNTREALFRDEREPWLGVQVLGSSPGLLGAAAGVLGDMGFDVIDLNMGCPVPKVVKRGSGAALLQDAARAAGCVEALAARARVKVTAKIRIVSAQQPRPTLELALALEGAGASALTIHGRTMEQGCTGPVAVEVLRAVARAVSIPVIANGGVVDRESAERLRRDTGCSRIMIARGAVGNPWIFRELGVRAGAPPPGHEELCDMLTRHVEDMIALYGERNGTVRARKIIHAYLAGRGYRRVRRLEAGFLESGEEFRAFMKVLCEEGPSRRSGGDRRRPAAGTPPG